MKYIFSCEVSFAGAQWQLPLPCLGGEGGSPEGWGVSMNDNYNDNGNGNDRDKDNEGDN